MNESEPINEVSLNVDVTSDRVLIVEGSFDVGFILALLRRNNRGKVEVFPVRGKDQFRTTAIARLVSDDKLQLRWVGLARDADQNPDGAFASLQGVMREFVQLRPRAAFGVCKQGWLRTGHGAGRSSTLFVFPSLHESGDVESWIWTGLAGFPIWECVEQYVECLVASGQTLARESKTRVFAYLAALARPDMPLGAAARAERIPMDSQHFLAFLNEIPDDDEVV